MGDSLGDSVGASVGDLEFGLLQTHLLGASVGEVVGLLENEREGAVGDTVGS